MNKENYPLKVLRDFKPLIKNLTSLAKSNANLIREYESLNILAGFMGVSHTSFFFAVHDHFDDEGGEISYEFEHKPTDENKEYSTKYQGSKDFVIEEFNKWLMILMEYETITFSDEEAILKQYEDEFYSEFEIIDADAHEKAFDPQQQELLYNWLTLLEKDIKLNAPKDISKLLIEDTLDLRDDIQNLTKKQFIERFSGLMAKVKKAGLKLLFDVFDVAKKEIIKKVLIGGAQELGTLAEHILNI